MNIVNPYYLQCLLDPLTGGADDDHEVEKYRHLNPNDEAKVKDIIRAILKPYFERFDFDSRDKAKTALRFYLSRPDSDFERVFNANLPPFHPPDDPRQFFVWMWQEFFPHKDFRLDSLDDFQIEEDINVTWKIKLSPEKAVDEP